MPTSPSPIPPLRPYDGPPRIHVAQAVDDLEASIAFYRELLGCEPSKIRPGYAKFEPALPPVNLTLNDAAGTKAPPLPSHFGIQVSTREAYDQVHQRLSEAGLVQAVRTATSCCYAVQDKVWVMDPSGHRWELFLVTEADIPTGSSGEASPSVGCEVTTAAAPLSQETACCAANSVQEKQSCC